MDEIKIHWSLSALKQRNSIFSYWNNRNKSNLYSIKINKQIQQRLEVVKRNPSEGKRVGFGDVRFSVLGKFSIYYVFRNGVVNVVSFWDNRQDPVKLLETLTE